MSKILIAVCSGISAYKIAELTRLFKKEQDDVKIIMTPSSTQFIPKITLQVLSQHSVRTELFDQAEEAKIDHISLARWPDQIIIAPATANTIAKIAHGICDNLVTTVCLASNASILFAPAMNKAMYSNPITQKNIQTLVDRGYQLIKPNSGEQACGETGVGRMAEPKEIFQQSKDKYPTPLKGLHLVITAGPTIERIDPVRYITNDSSGKMGYAIANQAILLGAKVTLISGKVHCQADPRIKLTVVESADEMHQLVMHEIKTADWFISTAAVSDYKVTNQSPIKIKKQNQESFHLNLTQNIDILKAVCEQPQKPFCIGFAAETNQVIEYGKKKRIQKGADFICANDVSQKDIGFNSEQNAITVIGEKTEKVFETMKKTELAKQLLLYLNQNYQEKT